MGMGDVMKDVFIEAIRGKRKIELTFHSKEDGHSITRKCAPMDYGPSKRKGVKDKITPLFHSWDYESDSDKGPHTLSLLREAIIDMRVLDEKFDPGEFIDWSTNWFISRDWGGYS